MESVVSVFISDNATAGGTSLTHGAPRESGHVGTVLWCRVSHLWSTTRVSTRADSSVVEGLALVVKDTCEVLNVSHGAPRVSPLDSSSVAQCSLLVHLQGSSHTFVCI